MRHTKRPSKYRFLHGALWSVAALIAMQVIQWVESSICALVKTGALSACSIVPAIAYQSLAVIAVVGCCASAYRYYRDFYVGEYYVDLAEAGYL